ncbi:MAG: DNA repair protein RecO, partial [Pirellulales bacterium]|nr:DNA repair protein RecO [Pirellulales bacterium]
MDPTTAVVLRTVEFSETSLIVTLLTRDFGRVSALAKGARRPKGPFEGSLDLLAVCRVVVLRKSSDALDLLTEAKLVRRFRGAERSLERLYAGYYIAEMLRQMTDDHDPHPNVYDLALQTLDQIDGTGDVASSVAYFDA